MFLELNHHNLKATQFARMIIYDIYKVSNYFPGHEKFAISSQVRRAAVSIYLNISEGCSRRSKSERIRFFEIARGSLVEVDAALDIAQDLNYFQKQNWPKLKENMISCFKILSSLIQSQH